MSNNNYFAYFYMSLYKQIVNFYKINKGIIPVLISCLTKHCV